MAKEVKIDIVKELSLIYELSLSIGNSLDLQQNCKDFLNVWMRQKNIDYGAVWLKNEYLNKEQPHSYSLIYAHPDFRVMQKETSLNQYVVNQLKEKSAISVNNEMDFFRELVTEKNIDGGTYWLINLPKLGFIKLYFTADNQAQASFSLTELKKASKVIQKFNIALQSCLLHNRIIAETEQKIRYQAEIKKLAIVAERTDNAIVITDSEGRIEWVNEGFSRITGYDFEEVKGRFPGSFLQGEETNSETKKYISEQLGLRNSFRTQILNYSKTGEKYWIDLSIQPIFDDNGTLINFMAVESDITDRIRYEVELKEAKEKAEEASRIKQEFLSVVSHEIRTPLNAIIGMTNLIQKTTLSPQQSDYINTVQISADNLQGIINSMLDFSKMESGKMTLQKIPFNLKKILQNIISSNEFKAEQKGLGLFLKFDEKVDITLIGDPIRLSQVLLNLVSNAIKFTDSGQIVIEAKQITKMNNALVVELSVTDTGKGIAEEKQKVIFESFTQEDSSISRKYGGTGLGLSISKQLVELMGGDLRVKSEVNQGATFSFIVGFSISQEPLEEKKEKSISSNLLIGKKILLVEDNAMNQFFAQKLLEGWGIKVEIAQNGKEGVDKFRAKYYDGILMDIQMPEMDGYQATKIIRKENTHIPIIALTALVIQEELNHFEAAGMNDYITKPFVAEELQQKLVKYLSHPQNYSITAPKNKVEQVESLYNNQLLSQMMKGNTVQVRQMEKLFVQQSEETVKQIKAYLEQKNWKQIGLLAHKIKASIDMLQINTLKQPIRQLELLGKQEKESSEIEQLVALTSQTLQQICTDILQTHQ